MRRARLEQGMRLLDVGGGLGGPARLLAPEAGYAVTVLNLSEELCRVGEMLSTPGGLERARDLQARERPRHAARERGVRLSRSQSPPMAMQSWGEHELTAFER